jgi:hypothetical protein
MSVHIIVVIMALYGTTAVRPPPSVLASIPPILDSVVASARESACNLSPALSDGLNQLFNKLALLSRDGFVVERWLQVLMVALAALLWCSGTKNL